MTEADITCAIMAGCVADEDGGGKARLAATGAKQRWPLDFWRSACHFVFYFGQVAPDTMRNPKPPRGRAPAPRPSTMQSAGFFETPNPFAAEQAIVTSISPDNVPNHPAVRATPAALADLARHGFTDDEIWALVVPKRTLARRVAEDEPLTVEETDKALRLERIAALADRVFGDPSKAHRWLRQPKSLLKGATPLAFLASETGARAVEQILNQIDHGIFA